MFLIEVISHLRETLEHHNILREEMLKEMRVTYISALIDQEKQA